MASKDPVQLALRAQAPLRMAVRAKSRNGCIMTIRGDPKPVRLEHGGKTDCLYTKVKSGTPMKSRTWPTGVGEHDTSHRALGAFGFD